MHIRSQLMRIRRCSVISLFLFLIRSLFHLLFLILLLLQEVVLEPKCESVHYDWCYYYHQNQL